MDKIKLTLPIKMNWNLKRNIPIYLLAIYFLFVIGTYISQHSAKDVLKGSLFLIFAVGILLLFSYIIEIEAVRRFFKRFRRWINGFLLILSPAVSFVMVEIMVGNYNLTMFKNYSQFNLVWYAIIYYFIYAILRDSKYTIIAANFLIYIAAMVNYFVYIFRGNPVLPSDLLAWKTGVSVASNYEVSFTIGYLIATLIMLALFVVASKLEHSEGKLSIINRIAGGAAYLGFAVFVFFMFFHTNLVKSEIQVLDFWAPKYTYCSYGTAFGFVANVEALESKAPEGYSVGKVKEAFQGTQQTKGVTKQKPNIIVIQNEAFSDLSFVGDYPTNMDYLPYTRSLTDNTIKGKMYTSVFGGGTSDTEYEFLTGNSMAVMPQNSVPFQQFITEPTNSIATTLKTQGYYNIAIHPYGKSGYKRDIVYPLIGFDEFLSMDDFVNPERIRSFISDKESYKKIIEEYEAKGKDKPLFIFNVTMQNHGGYSTDKLFSAADNVLLTGDLKDKYPEAEQYLSLERQTDLAFKELTDYFSKQKEPTIILIYGDHQPIAFAPIHDDMPGEGVSTYMDVFQKKYEVPFIMWANYDIKETYVDKMSANYLSSYLLQTAGLEGTQYNDYLMKLYQKLPVITGLFYIDKQNDCYKLEEPSSYSDLINQYQIVGYNNALDKKNRLKNYFKLNN